MKLSNMLEQLNTHSEFFLDFETKSGTDLKKVGAYKYIQNAEFKILTLAVKPLEKSFLKAYNITEFEKVIIGHNVSFEAMVLQRIGFDISKTLFVCTAALSRFLGGPNENKKSSLEACAIYWKLRSKKYSRGKELIKYFKSKPEKNTPIYRQNMNDLKYYCKMDTILCAQLFEKLEAHAPISLRQEILYQHATTMLNLRPLKINTDLLYSLKNTADKLKLRLESEFEKTFALNPRSPLQVLKYLNKVKNPGEPDLDSVNKKAIALKYESLNDKQKTMLKFRDELNSTGYKKLNTIYLRQHKGFASPNLVHFGTKSGRAKSYGIGVLNFPRTQSVPTVTKLSDINFLLRNLIIPTRKPCLLQIDYRQIEFRMLLYLAKYTELLSKLVEGYDFYTEFARKAFNKKEITKRERFIGKVCVLSIMYGASATSLARTVGDQTLKPTLQYMIDIFMHDFPRLVTIWHELHKAVKEKQSLTLLNGSKRFFNYNEFRFAKNSLTGEQYRVSPQAIGARLLSIYNQSMVRELIYEKRQLVLSEVIFDIHDELLFEGDEKDIAYLQKVLEAPVQWLPNFKLQTDVELVSCWR